MKNLYPFSRLSLLAALLLFLVLINSCKKDNLSKTTVLNVAPLTGQNIISESKIKNWFSTHEIGKYIIPDLANAQQQVIGNVNVVKIPIQGFYNASAADVKTTAAQAVKLFAADTLHFFNPKHPPMLFFFAKKGDPDSTSLKATMMDFFPDVPGKENGDNGVWTGKLIEWDLQSKKIGVQHVIENYAKQKGELNLNQALNTSVRVNKAINSIRVMESPFTSIWDMLKAVVNAVGIFFGVPGEYEYNNLVYTVTWCDFLWGLFCDTGESGGSDGSDGGGGTGYISGGALYDAVYSGYINAYNGGSGGNWSHYDGGTPPPNPCYSNAPAPNSTKKINTINGCPILYNGTYGVSFGDFNFNGLDDPINFPDDPIIDYGIGITDVDPNTPNNGPGTLIGTTTNRNSTEDMLHGDNPSTDGIRLDHNNSSDDVLFGSMTTLMHATTVFDSGLQGVADQMIQKFRNRSGGTFENATLNSRVSFSSQFINFLGYFGDILNNKLHDKGGDITSVGKIDIDRHPIFNGLHNKFYGLMILLDDTEYTEIRISNYTVSGTKWSATLDVVIHDHFGVDKNDALSYQNYPLGYGFADWWILQHLRNYAPFETIVHVQKNINGDFQ